MDPDFTFLMGMAVGALIIGFIQLFFRGRGKRKVVDAGGEPRLEAENRRRVREVEELRERLAVLERIATDPAIRTASEIEKLR
ncbi:MAG: hypothetical protein M3N39_04055 [Pseudomonadota bacterium]|nr:hypothetical protein [Pseudomonadota bacterium]